MKLKLTYFTGGVRTVTELGTYLINPQPKEIKVAFKGKNHFDEYELLGECRTLKEAHDLANAHYKDLTNITLNKIYNTEKFVDFVKIIEKGMK